MSGNHNKYCSGNQPDLVQRLRDADWNDNNELFSMAADTIEFLRQQLAKRPRIDEPMLKGATDTAAMIVNELRQQLAECERDAKRYRYLRHASRRECLELNGPEAGCWIDCEDEANTLILLTEEDADAAIDAALAKLGADKTGEAG